jgi:hypothetical protein
MGVERAVTRWYARRQSIQEELAILQKRLEQLPSEPQTQEERTSVEGQLAEVQVRLTRLGPCPRAMMG